jgi:hypothetical protein
MRFSRFWVKGEAEALRTGDHENHDMRAFGKAS